MKTVEAHDLLIRIDENVKKLVKADDDKEKRIRKLEKNRWVHGGVVAVGAALLAKLGIAIPIGH